jgi:dCTP deaminase
VLASDRSLAGMKLAGRLSVRPTEPELLQPASIDLRLDRWFRVFQNHRYDCIDPRLAQDDLTELVQTDDDQPFVLHPGEFVLGSTLEEVGLDESIAARIEGKSSLGRLGLLVHSTAGFIDPGFRGHITLELSNAANLPIRLWPGMRIGQLCVFALTTPASAPYGAATYGSHYQGQRGPTTSRSHQNFRTWSTYTEESVDA